MADLQAGDAPDDGHANAAALSQVWSGARRSAVWVVVLGVALVPVYPAWWMASRCRALDRATGSSERWRWAIHAVVFVGCMVAVVPQYVLVTAFVARRVRRAERSFGQTEHRHGWMVPVACSAASFLAWIWAIDTHDVGPRLLLGVAGLVLFAAPLGAFQRRLNALSPKQGTPRPHRSRSRVARRAAVAVVIALYASFLAMVVGVLSLVIVSGHIGLWAVSARLPCGTFVVSDRLAYEFSAPERGDIVAVAQPGQFSRVVVIVAQPGDAVRATNSGISVNHGRFQRSGLLSTVFTSGILRGDMYIIRISTDDGWALQYVRRRWITGRIVMAFWPISAAGIITGGDTQLAQTPPPFIACS